MFDAFAKAIGQLNDPAFRRVVMIGLAAALGVLVGLWMVIGFTLSSTALFAIGWLEFVADILGGLGAIVLAWILFPGVISAVVAFMLEDIAGAVEAKHYPNLPPTTEPGLAGALLATARFLAVVLAVNMVVLLFLFIPPLFPFVFYGANGYLLGREYFEMAAMRRMAPAEARSLRKAHRGRVFLTGTVIAFLLTVPVVNLLAPIIATAVMVHLFQSWRPGGEPDQGTALRMGATRELRE
ncbi:MAG: EI24 domain-containing protein [Rhodospirillales bacterium]